jgi:uncharacterized delta-60 repeat protein/uncharacterized repeat protein (TIGR01451 family)
MKFHPINILRSLIFLFFLVFISQNKSLAQNPGSPDTTLGLGTFNGPVRIIKVQSDGRILVGGDFTKYKTATINRIARFNIDGSLDNTFKIGAGADSSIYSIAIQTDGKILASGWFTSFNGISQSRVVRLNSDGSLDNTFNIGSGANSLVNSIVLQADGKILLGGYFTLINSVSQNYLSRLNIDGSLDNTFNLGSGLNGLVFSLAIQGDGKILAGGTFTTFNGASKNFIIRLNGDGSLDNTFNTGSGPNDIVSSIVPQADGKILVGGYFTSYNSATYKKYINRLNPDGSNDASFYSTTSADNSVYSMALQLDGKILVGGAFRAFNNISKNFFVRLNADGTLDNTFNIGSGANNSVYTIALQADGKILAGGLFTSFNQVSKNFFVCLNVDGSNNSILNLGAGTGNVVYVVAIQSDRKILIGGAFANFNGVPKNYLVRLNPDGSFDNTFNFALGDTNEVNNLVIQPDGKIIVWGYFTYTGVSENFFVRLNSDGSLDKTFNIGSGANDAIYSIILQGDGKILLGGIFYTFNGVSSRLIRLNSDGSVDNTFNIGSGPNGTVNSLALQPDGKILVGGSFTIWDNFSYSKLVRLNVNGTVDNSLNIGSGFDNEMQSIIMQPDGKILIGGGFAYFNGLSSPFIVRLNSDGSRDNTFNVGSGPSNQVKCMLLQADGKIVIGGDFYTFDGISKNYIVRLNVDGSLDNSFVIGTGIKDFNTAKVTVNSLALQNDGKIIVGGKFCSFNGVAYNCILRLQGNPDYSNTIRGSIFSDDNKDCLFQASEKPLNSAVVKVIPGPYYVGTDVLGHYRVKVDSGSTTYTLTQSNKFINTNLLINQCAVSHNVSLSGSTKDTCCFDFSDSLRACAFLNINVQNDEMIRCYKRRIFINYCNYGDTAALGSKVKVIFPSYVIPLSAIPMWTIKQDSVLIFDLGSIYANSCGKIIITDSISCDPSIRGLTQCIKAVISPASVCVSENPAWDRSSMEVKGACLNGIINFTITNVGSGNMIDSLQYRVYVNDTLIFSGNYKLISGGIFNVSYPAQGQTIRLEADQSPYYPVKSRPRVTIENCGVTVPQVRDLMITAPQDDLEEEVSITCNTIRDSYDPNDKKAIPQGIGSTNKISPGEEIEYTIRFQNTGTATAFNVKVVDTLDVNLDISTFAQGSSSHPYTLNVSGKGQAVLSLNFYNINLPDSTTNKLASNGLVSFRITVPLNTMTGTQIKNKAYIFFDYNSPIITNETMHTVDATVYSDLSRGSAVQVGQTIVSGVNRKYNEYVKIYPNPTAGIITMEMPESGTNMEMKVYSVIGVLHKSVTLNKSLIQQVNLESLNQGMYIYEIWQDGMRKAGGKLEVK